MKKHILTFLSLISLLFSQDVMNLEDDFLKSLDDVSEIATKTKLNIDETPSFITVLHSEKLQKLGVKNVFEALSFVPGVELKKESSGVMVVVFRGVTQKSEVKLMVDGVNINNTYRGSIYYYLSFPMELIKRIEVIRGAGSILYGSNAISGVINIITKISQDDEENSVFISAGSYDNYKSGAYLSTKISDFKLSLDGYMQKDKKTIYVGANPSNQTGESDRHLDDYSFGLNLKNKDFSFMARIKKSEAGNAYGVFDSLDKDLDKYENINTSIFAKLSYKMDISTNNKINFSTGYNKYIQEVNDKTTSGLIINAIYKEDSYFGELNFISKSLKNNELLVGLRYEDSRTLQSNLNVNGITSRPISKPDLKRETTSIYINDTYFATDSLNLSAGLRFDHYNDFGESTNPNLGVVYKLNKDITFKALYSKSFRAPSWIELTSNPLLQAEHSNSIEGGVIYKPNTSNTLRVNIYKTRIEDMIVKDSELNKYMQDTKNTFLGAELEYTYLANSQLEFNFFISHVEAKDNNDEDIPEVANMLASTSVTYELDSGFVFGSVLKYVSSSKRCSTDIRDDMKHSFIFNQTISYDYKDFTASLVVKDLFNSNTYYALSGNHYKLDFDDGGREILFNIELDF